MNWLRGLKGRLRFNEPLYRHSSFRIGGKAKFWYEPKDTADLRNLIRKIRQHSIPVAIIGNGSNILFDDEGFSGICIKLSSKDFSYIRRDGDCLICGSGVRLSRLINFARENNLGGVEFLAGIPGTLGGALVMNTGTDEKSISELILEVTVMDYSGDIRRLKRREIVFSYRKSSLSRYILLDGRLKLFRMDKALIERHIRHIMDTRRERQDYRYPSAGCVFKNPPGDSAGRLIDICGLKGKHVGAAQISRRHGNFIINRGGATCRDVIRLMDMVRKEVREKLGVYLEPEIKILRN